MSKSIFSGFWKKISRSILNNRILIILLLGLATYFFSTNWENIRFTYTEANLLPETHPENIKYKKFTDKFGEEGNLIVISVKDSTLFTIEKLNAWNNLSHSFKDHQDVSTVIAFGDLQKLKKNKSSRQFYIEPFIRDSISNKFQLDLLKEEIFNKSPFYDKFLINSESQAVRTAINLKTEVVNTIKRENFVINILEPRVKEFEEKYNLDVRISGMPYVRTKYSQTIKAELGKFLILAALVTSIIFFLFFRSLRATIISIFTVLIGVMWTLGIVGLLEYELTVLTAIIPVSYTHLTLPTIE